MCLWYRTLDTLVIFWFSLSFITYLCQLHNLLSFFRDIEEYVSLYFLYTISLIAPNLNLKSLDSIPSTFLHSSLQWHLQNPPNKNASDSKTFPAIRKWWPHSTSNLKPLIELHTKYFSSLFLSFLLLSFSLWLNPNFFC